MGKIIIPVNIRKHEMLCNFIYGSKDECGPYLLFDFYLSQMETDNG
jgi:hypothetical protein